MNKPPIEFQYHFRCPGEEPRSISFHIELDPRSTEHRTIMSDPLPEWAKLDFHRCEQCPLDESRHLYCPAALAIAEVVECFHELLSYDEVEVTVVTPQRTYNGITSAQRALSSLIGLYLATSGCPTLAKLKPMARFHLPFASREETLFRSASTYLLGQFIRKQKGLPADFELEGLKDLYAQLHDINISLAKRLRALSAGDANINALVLLDLYAQDLPMSLESKLAEFANVFNAFIEVDNIRRPEPEAETA